LRKAICIIRSTTGCVYAVAAAVKVCAINCKYQKVIWHFHCDTLKRNLEFALLFNSFTAVPPVTSRDFVSASPTCGFFETSPAVFGLKPVNSLTGSSTCMYNLIV